MPTKIQSVSVVGLGKLGLCLAAVLASRGYIVRGVDLDNAKVDAINRRKSPIYEPGLERLLRKGVQHLEASTTFAPAIGGTDVTFVVVPTPSDDSGGFSLKFVIPAMENIGRELAKKDGYHLVVLTSTVMPGSMNAVVKPLLEEMSKKACGREFGLCYNPEFIALGDVIRGLLQPDFILIGESDPKAGSILSGIQKHICRNSPPIERMAFVNAELAKIAVNSYVTMKMSFANTLAEISEKMPGGDVDRITSAIGKDKRIGNSYLKGALGYGGPCFPRDNVAFAYYAESVGAQARIAKATNQVNVEQTHRIVTQMEEKGLKKGMKVGILGLSYKPNTNVVERSQSLQLAQHLKARGYEVSVFDPAAMGSAKAVLGTEAYYCNSAGDCVKRSDYVVLATPWRDFRRLSVSQFRGKVVFDCWRFFKDDVRKASTYFSIGRW